MAVEGDLLFISNPENDQLSLRDGNSGLITVIDVGGPVEFEALATLRGSSSALSIGHKLQLRTRTMSLDIDYSVQTYKMYELFYDNW